jgi:hypothetical protein
VSEIEPDAVESALDALGVAWKKREDGWAIPATARTPCEIAIVTNDGGLRIEGVLATWDAAGETELAALGAMLRRAAADLPGATFEVRPGRAVVAVDADDERGLGAAVSRVFTASRLLSREAAALLERDVADRYLAFFGAGAETPVAPARI